MNISTKIILAAATSFAIIACDSNEDRQASEQQENPQAAAQTEARTGQTIALRLFEAKEDACAFLVGQCLNDTRDCLSLDDQELCGPSFDGCRESMFAQACESDAEIDIGLASTLRCWNEFEACAGSNEDDATCASALNTCVAQGSVCEIDAESKCDAEVCEADDCEEVRWGWGSGWGSGSSWGNSWGKSWGNSSWGNSWGKGWGKGSSWGKGWGKSNWGSHGGGVKSGGGWGSHGGGVKSSGGWGKGSTWG